MLGFNDPKRKFERQTAKFQSDLERLIQSGRLINGVWGEKLSAKVANFLGAKSFCPCANGTDAISIACLGAGLPKNSKVILPTLSAPASVVGVLRANLEPVFVDVSDDGLIDKSLLMERIAKKDISAALIVHLYGSMVHPETIRDAMSLNRIIIEDCAQAFGSHSGNEFAGSIGHFGAHSFYPTKNLSTIGDGGGVSIGNTSNFSPNHIQEIAEYGWDRAKEVIHIGLNSRLDEVHAMFLLSGLAELEKHTKEKQCLAGEYLEALHSKTSISAILKKHQLDEICPHLFVIRCKEPQKIDELAKKYNILLGRHYPKALPDHTYFSSFEVVTQKNKSLIGREIATDGRSLPCFVGMTEAEKTSVLEFLGAVE